MPPFNPFDPGFIEYCDAGRARLTDELFSADQDRAYAVEEVKALQAMRYTLYGAHEQAWEDYQLSLIVAEGAH